VGILKMQFCDYGCGRPANFKFKNGKCCCENNISKCPAIIDKIRKDRCGELNPNYGKRMSNEERKKRSKFMTEQRADPDSSFNTKSFKEKQKKSLIKVRNTKEWKNKAKKWMEEAWKDNRVGNQEWKEKQKQSQKLTIRKIKNKYPFFSQIEEMRYTPDKPGEKEIQVHCKNHNCPNSKEQGGWFTPSYIQLYERIRQLEKDYGNEGCYFYCCEECKQQCPLYKSRGADPFRDLEKSYTQEEYNIWRKQVLKKDNYECQKCGSKENLHCHHIIPVKIEPIFALDPDNGIVLCQKCHYKYGHKINTECSTGKLAKKVCD
jgi:5-methylcytosine-specific restriction endonuclease McrA